MKICFSLPSAGRNKNPVDKGDLMNTNRELNYRLFVQTEEDFKRTEIRSEFARYDDIKNGDIEKVRVCIDGGMKHNIAYTLSDIYIRRGDKCREPQELIELTETMMLDFAERMAEIRKENSVSLHIRRTVDYIYKNLHRPLTLKMAAEHEHLDPSYLSKLFAKEMGIPIKAYILKAKVTTAQSILTFSDFSIADIADSLGFSSQSAFAAAFRKITGLTPMQYRNRYSEEYSLRTKDE